jgi:hypothetical protein
MAPATLADFLRANPLFADLRDGHLRVPDLDALRDRALLG